MKRFTFILVFSLISMLSFAQFPLLEIGEKSPLRDLKMMDVSGKMIALEDVKKEEGLLVIFSCNSCPFVIAWENRYNPIHNLAKENKVGMILVNSNESKRSGADSYRAMKRHASEKHYTMPYVLDEKSEVANAFGAKTTPHVFLFDKNLNLVYMGAIDDNHKSAKEVTKEWLKDAITNMVQDKTIAPNITRALGCGIKR